MNLSDGSVLCEAEGRKSTLVAFQKEVRDYFSSYLDDEITEIKSPTGKFLKFKIRY